MNKSLLRWALAVLLILVVVDFATTIFATLRNPGYDWMKQSISLLGNSASTTHRLMMVWGVFFSLLLCTYGWLLQRLTPANPIIGRVSWLVCVYGIGEGVGSGLFPFDHVAGQLTISGWTHSIVGVVGNLALLAVPLVALPYFKTREKYFYQQSILFAGVGFAMQLLFALSRLPLFQETFVANRGLWQRLFLGTYFSYMIFFTLKLIAIYQRQPVTSFDLSHPKGKVL